MLRLSKIWQECLFQKWKSRLVDEVRKTRCAFNISILFHYKWFWLVDCFSIGSVNTQEASGVGVGVVGLIGLRKFRMWFCEIIYTYNSTYIYHDVFSTI